MEERSAPRGDGAPAEGNGLRGNENPQVIENVFIWAYRPAQVLIPDQLVTVKTNRAVEVAKTHVE